MSAYNFSFDEFYTNEDENAS